MNRENTEELLMVQCASRICFNRGEKLNYLTWILCIGIATASLFNNFVAIVTVVILDFLLFVTTILFDNNVKKGADFRAYFDNEVLKYINNDKKQNKDIISEARKLQIQHSAFFAEQVVHTAHDNPPGVKDWYKVNESLPEVDAEIACERENIGFDSQMITYRGWALSILSCVLLTSWMILTIIYCPFDRGALLIGYGGLFVKLMERVIRNIQYYGISKCIEGMMSCVNSKSMEQLSDIQVKIDEKRRIPVYGINWLYKRHASELEKVYSTDTKEKQ